MHVGRDIETAKAVGAANLLAWSVKVADGSPAPDPSKAVMDELRKATMRAELYGEMLRLEVDADQAAALVTSTERIRGLVVIEAAERDRVVRYAKIAHEMGVDEREIEIAQQTAGFITAAFRAAMAAVASSVLTPGDKDAMLRAFLVGLGVPAEDLQLEAGGGAA